MVSKQEVTAKSMKRKFWEMVAALIILVVVVAVVWWVKFMPEEEATPKPPEFNLSPGMVPTGPPKVSSPTGPPPLE